MIDMDRLNGISSGQLEPSNLGEELFLRMYTRAMEGELLFVTLMDMTDAFESLNILELNLILLGFAMGQHDLETMEYELTSDNNKKLH